MQILLRLTLAIKTRAFQCNSVFSFIGGSETQATSEEEWNSLTVHLTTEALFVTRILGTEQGGGRGRSRNGNSCTSTQDAHLGGQSSPPAGCGANLAVSPGEQLRKASARRAGQAALQGQKPRAPKKPVHRHGRPGNSSTKKIHTTLLGLTLQVKVN